MTVCFNCPTDSTFSFATLVDLLSYRATHQPEQKAFTFLRGGETESAHLTYGELQRQAQAIATQLQALVPPGSRALLVYPPGLEFVVAFFGCQYAGVTAVPVYPPRRNQSLSRLQTIVADAQASVLLTTSALSTSLKERSDVGLDLTGLPWVVTDELSHDAATVWQLPVIEGSTLALLQYTSGSTGNPKGVMLSHGNLLHNSRIICNGFQNTSSKVGISWLPVYHDMGLIGGVLQPIYVGALMVLMSPVDFLQKPFRWLKAISHYQATTSGGPNFAYDLCLQKITPEQRETLDLSSWDVAFTGAEPVRAETLTQFAATFASCGFRNEAFYPCYGMAETTLMVSGGLQSAPPVIRTVDRAALEKNRVVAAKADHETAWTIVGCGQVQLDQQVVIVNPDTRLRCDEKQVGEIWVAGPSVAQGYWQQEEATEQAFRAHLADTNEGPFLRTGDLGFLQDGELFITGRLKDVIIIRGQNHYPQDIELTVEKSHPALRPNCGAAFSVDCKGAERLVIVQEVERSYLKNLDVKEIINSIRQSVAAQHGIDIYATVLVRTNTIPKTSSGKIRRHACRAEFLAGSLEVIDDWGENPQVTTKFLNLQSEVESVLQRLQGDKRFTG